MTVSTFDLVRTFSSTRQLEAHMRIPCRSSWRTILSPRTDTGLRGLTTLHVLANNSTTSVGTNTREQVIVPGPVYQYTFALTQLSLPGLSEPTRLKHNFMSWMFQKARQQPLSPVIRWSKKEDEVACRPGPSHCKAVQILLRLNLKRHVGKLIFDVGQDGAGRPQRMKARLQSPQLFGTERGRFVGICCKHDTVDVLWNVADPHVPELCLYPSRNPSGYIMTQVDTLLTAHLG